MFFSPHIIIQIFAILFDQHEWLTTQNETHIGAKKKSCRIYYLLNYLNTEYHKKHNLKLQKNKKTLSSRKFLAPLWNSMCQSVLLKHILLCPCMLRAFGKKIDQLTLIDEGYVLYQVFVIPKKGTYFVFSKISKKTNLPK